MIEVLLKKYNPFYKIYTSNAVYNHNLGDYGTRNFIHKSVDIFNPENLFLKDSITIQKNSWINIISNNGIKGRIEIDDHTNIGRNCSISSARKIIIGKSVLFGMNVYIADHEHRYKDVLSPIMYQGLNVSEGLEIKDNTWIGANVVISSSKKLTIGKNVVIGANSVVKSDIPDFCVAVGSPAKVILMYDKKKKDWIKK